MQFSALALAAFATLSSGETPLPAVIVCDKRGARREDRIRRRPESRTSRRSEVGTVPWLTRNNSPDDPRRQRRAKRHTHLLAQQAQGRDGRRRAVPVPVGRPLGFNSGFMQANASATSFPTYTIMVNSTGPIWAYCAKAKHCQAGMALVINEK